MTDTDTTAATAEVFDDIVKSRGGHAALSRWDIDVCAMVASITVASRIADAVEMIKHSETITRLMALLPPVAVETIPPLDLTVLTDAQLRTLEHLQRIMLHEIAPDVPEPPPPEPPPMGAAERIGKNLGAWIDERRERWCFCGPDALEANHMRNELSSLCYPAITRNLWRSIWDAERDAAVSKAVMAEQDRLSATKETKVATPAPSSEPAPPGLNVYDIAIARVRPFGDYE